MPFNWELFGVRGEERKRLTDIEVLWDCGSEDGNG
jgi:hypothetical protein